MNLITDPFELKQPIKIKNVLAYLKIKLPNKNATNFVRFCMYNSILQYKIKLYRIYRIMCILCVQAKAGVSLMLDGESPRTNGLE
jgi:hypothetical protein